MSDQEKKVTDTTGRYLHAIEGGEECYDASWTRARFVVTNRRIIVFSADNNKFSLSLADLDTFEDRCDVVQAAATENYAALRFDDDVVLVSTDPQLAFETRLCAAAVDGDHIHLKYSETDGDVGDLAWQDGRVHVTATETKFVIRDGGKTVIQYDSIESLSTATDLVDGDPQTVFELEYTQAASRVETHVATTEAQRPYFRRLFRNATGDVFRGLSSLSEQEREVLVALYSGVSAWEVPGFIGADVDTVEEIYDHLLDLDIVELTRRRREVALTSKGRGKASDAR